MLCLLYSNCCSLVMITDIFYNTLNSFLISVVINYKLHPFLSSEYCSSRKNIYTVTKNGITTLTSTTTL